MPLAYGFADPELEPFDFEEIVVLRSTDLRKIARYAGSSYEELRELNPELLQPATPQNRYVLRLPPGTKEIYQRQLANEPVRGRRVRAVQDKAGKGEPALSRKAAVEPAAPADWNNPPIISPFAAQINPGFKAAGYAEALLSSERTPVQVLR